MFFAFFGVKDLLTLYIHSVKVILIPSPIKEVTN